MRTRMSGFLVAGLLLFTQTDRSGQDAYPYGLKAQYAASTGKYQEALDLYQLAYRLAAAASATRIQDYFLNNIGACQLALFRYNDAEQTLVQVRQLADAAHDDQTLAGADGNLAAVYVQLDDIAAAEMYARESLLVYSRTARQAQRARAMLTLAEILSHASLTPESEQLFQTGIDSATRLQDWGLASAGWLHYGSALLDGDRIPEADRAFSSSYQTLRKNVHPGKTGPLNGEYAILWNLSRLRLRQHDFKSALALVDSAIRISPPSGGRISPLASLSDPGRRGTGNWRCDCGAAGRPDGTSPGPVETREYRSRQR